MFTDRDIRPGVARKDLTGGSEGPAQARWEESARKTDQSFIIPRMRSKKATMNPTTAIVMIAGTIATISEISVGTRRMISSRMGPTEELRSADTIPTNPASDTAPIRSRTFHAAMGFWVVTVSVIIERWIEPYLKIAASIELRFWNGLKIFEGLLIPGP